MNTLSSWELNSIDLQLIDLAFIEDLGQPYCDQTTALLFPVIKENARAILISKHPQPIVLCGLPIIKTILQRSGDCIMQSDYADGQIIPPGATLCTLLGRAQTILMTERILLNFLQRLCAIATLTSHYVEKIKHTHAQILDTRKTAPGFRHLEKYAVQCGGGVNHRMGLYDAIMIKDTHVDLLGGMAKALAKLPDDVLQKCPVIVEVRTVEELKVVLEQGLHKVTRVLLDNMSPALMCECAVLCEGRIPTEASGNMSLDTITTAAECGVDYISVGKLTHSAGSVDLSIKCEF